MMSSSALMVASHADTPALPVWGLLRRTGRHIERVGRKRQRGDSNPCGQSPMDFESISLTARTHCHVRRAFSGATCLRCSESCHQTLSQKLRLWNFAVCPRCIESTLRVLAVHSVAFLGSEPCACSAVGGACSLRQPL